MPEMENGAIRAGVEGQGPAAPAVEGGNEQGPAAPAMEGGRPGPAGEGHKNQTNAQFAQLRRKTQAQLKEKQQQILQQAQQAQKLADKERERTVKERTRLHAAEQLRRIAKLDPQVRTMEQLRKLPSFPEMERYVKLGLSLEEAFKLANYDAARQKLAYAAQLAARNGAAAKNHMRPLGGQSGRSLDPAVPEEVAKAFRQAKPGISDREIREKYRRFKSYKRQ